MKPTERNYKKMDELLHLSNQSAISDISKKKLKYWNIFVDKLSQEMQCTTDTIQNQKNCIEWVERRRRKIAEWVGE